MTAPTLTVALHLGPVTETDDGLGADLVATVRNDGDDDVAPEFAGSTLLVDDEPYDSWSLVAGNGASVAGDDVVQPGATVRFERRLGLSPFDPGPHDVVLEVLGVPSPSVTIEVPAAPD